MEVVVEDEEEVKARIKRGNGLQQFRKASNRAIRTSMMTLLKTRTVKDFTELAYTLAEPNHDEEKIFL